MTSSGHAFGHVSNTEKLQRLPGFALFLKGLILRGFQNVKKFVISDQSMILKKECIAMFSNLSKKARFNENRISLFKETEVPSIYIGSYPVSACAVYTTRGPR